MLDNVVTRRIAGTAGAVIMAALVYLGLKYAFEPDTGSFEIEAQLGTAGVGLSQGNSVKVRGVEVGQVVNTSYREGRAYATLRFDPGTELPKNQLDLRVTAKTLLGEKQVEIAFPAALFGQAPFLEQGDLVVQNGGPTEVQDALDAITPFLDAIDEQDLATVIDVLGSQQGEGEIIARALDVSAQVSNFLSRTAPDTIDRFKTLTSVVNQLTPAADEFDRLNRNLPAAVSLLSERREDLDTNLDLLSAFSITLADYVQVDGGRLRQLLLTSDAVGTVLDPNMDNIASFIEGAHQYTETLGRPSDFLADGTVWGGFRMFVDLEALGLPIGQNGVDLSPILGGLGGLPVDVTEITDVITQLLPGILPGGGRTTGLRNQPPQQPARQEPAPPPAQPEPAPAPPEPEPSPSETAEQGSLLGDEEGGRR